MKVALLLVCFALYVTLAFGQASFVFPTPRPGSKADDRIQAAACAGRAVTPDDLRAQWTPGQTENITILIHAANKQNPTLTVLEAEGKNPTSESSFSQIYTHTFDNTIDLDFVNKNYTVVYNPRASKTNRFTIELRYTVGTDTFVECVDVSTGPLGESAAYSLTPAFSLAVFALVAAAMLL